MVSRGTLEVYPRADIKVRGPLSFFHQWKRCAHEMAQGVSVENTACASLLRPRDCGIHSFFGILILYFRSPLKQLPRSLPCLLSRLFMWMASERPRDSKT